MRQLAYNVCSFAGMTSLTSRHHLIIQNLVKIKTKKTGWNVNVDIMYIRGDDIIYNEFKTLQLYNFVKIDQNAKNRYKLCTRFFFHET